MAPRIEGAAKPWPEPISKPVDVSIEEVAVEIQPYTPATRDVAGVFEDACSRSVVTPSSQDIERHSSMTSHHSAFSKATSKSGHPNFMWQQSLRSSKLAEDGDDSGSESSHALPKECEIRRRRCSVVERVGKLSESYEVLEELGRGSFGVVTKAKCIRTGVQHAVKSLTCKEASDYHQVEVELEIARRVSHPNVVRLHEAIRDGDTWHFVMELYSGGTLHDRVDSYASARLLIDEACDRAASDAGSAAASSATGSSTAAGLRAACAAAGRAGGLPAQLCAKYAWQMLSGIAYLHHHRYAHRDIKAENYLLESQAEDAPLRLGDFGLSKNFAPARRMTSKVGTPYTTAPEVYEGNYDEKCDVWSVGIVLFMCCIGSPPFYGETPEATSVLVQTEDARFDGADWQFHPAAAQGLVRQLLSRAPETRPSAKQVIAKNAWLRKATGQSTARSESQGACCAVS
mmetsp:Transcript_81621/g.205374  ORF Transcript_81621/g.205374 Transcript_81621/m.205374 type:complete len:458 (-) Transcript_81621:76-1449(-)